MTTGIALWETIVEEVQVVERLVNISHQVDEETEIHGLGVEAE